MTAREAVAHIRSIAQRVTGSAEDFVCSCLCPDHGQGKGDRSPSLSVRYDGSRALLHCFVGCTVEAIVSAAGLQMRDLFDGPGDGRASKDKRDMLRTYLRSRTWICSGPDGASYQHHRLDHVWYDARHYERAVRWWQRGAKAKRLMYRAGDVDSSRIVFVEGEPAADALAAISEGVKVLATVCGAPTLPDPDVLAWHVGDGPHAVLLWPDGDPVGREHMRGIQAMLPGSRIIDTSRLPGRVEADKPGADAADWTGHELTPGAVWGALLEAAVAALPEPDAPVPRLPPQPVDVAAGTSRDGLQQSLAAVGVGMRYNIRAGRVEMRVGDGAWTERTDRLAARTIEEIAEHCTWRDKQLRFSRSRFIQASDALLADAEVDPFLDYLRSLPAWDGVRRLENLIDTVFRLVGRPDPRLIALAGRLTMVGVAVRALRPGSRLHTMLVVVGERQGTAKSSWVEWMLPESHRADWFSLLPALDRPAKEMVEATQGRVLLESSEMQGSTRADIARLKAYLSTANDGGHRMAYRRDPESRPRRFAIVGTANEWDCLPNDPSGLRRFLALRVERRMDADQVRCWMDQHREQLWAEALADADAGREAYLTPDLEDVHEKHHVGARSASPVVVDLVHAYLALSPTNDWRRIEGFPADGRFVRLSRLLRWAREESGQQLMDRSITAELRATGWRQASPRDGAGKQHRLWERP